MIVFYIQMLNKKPVEPFIDKNYKEDMKYTDFAAGETRCEYSGLRSTNSYAD